MEREGQLTRRLKFMTSNMELLAKAQNTKKVAIHMENIASVEKRINRAEESLGTGH